MSKQKIIEICTRCKSELQNSFCSNCGQARELTRINGQYILSEIGSVLNFNKGILFTIKELLLRPGLNIQKFILDDRNRLVKPIVYIIICSLTYTILQQLVGFEDGYVAYSYSENVITTSIFEWVSENYGYANVLIAVFIAFWVKIFFRKYEYNFFEILILLLFMMGTGMLIFSFLGIVGSLINLEILDKMSIIGVLYISWGIGQFFDKGKKANYLKAFFSYVLGIFSFTLAILLFGGLINLITGQ